MCFCTRGLDVLTAVYSYIKIAVFW
jgi:hypothetical protein